MATLVPELPYGICWGLSHNYYIPAQHLPLPYAVFLIHSLPGILRAHHPALLQNKLPVCKSLSSETRCKEVLVLLGWRWWIDARVSSGDIGKTPLSRLGATVFSLLLCIRHWRSLELHNELRLEQALFSIKIMSFSFSNSIMVSKVLF